MIASPDNVLRGGDHGAEAGICGGAPAIIALEFKRSLLVLAEQADSVVQVRAVVLIALLAVVRKLIILDIKTTEAMQIFALAAAILALGGVYWLVREQDSKRRGRVGQDGG